ncbi:DUF7281 domain-containing protein [Marinobacterium sedimentorum]|uniref:DUF7281 domain-containing protein n=1 Tax=Marinobacterium sedimentorum TaxID=2927804 RepID=UPI0020C634CC|nr:hypothetical protein [Marinobacterium sedimentorum]MCP8687145.1 hypothetical protein [Marinobacterium sedimentorum]
MRLKFQVIQNALRKGLNQVSLNKTWEAIHHEMEIGEIRGRMLIFQSGDIELLRQLMHKETGHDPVHESLHGSRIKMAQKAANEKLSSQSVFGNLLQVARLNGASIPIAGSTCAALTPPGTLLSVRENYLLLDDIPNVILTENGSAAVYWDCYRYPREVGDALIIYRGHGQDSSVVRNLIQNRPKTTRLYGFFDLDPAGITMALQYKVDALVIPAQLEDQWHQANSWLQEVNQSKVHAQQYDELRGLERYFQEHPGISSGRLGEVFDFVKCHQIAIMQEHMTRDECELVALNI